MIKKTLLKMVKFYQLFVSPSMGINCRFYPSCSHYFTQAIHKHGTAKGSWLGVKRILKCAPWSRGGIDLP